MTFVQFYSYTRKYLEWNNNQRILVLNNGFSSVWNYIKNKGDIVWVDPSKSKFPEVTSPVYISCSWLNEFKYITEWVASRPDISFIVGGPAVSSSKINLPYNNFKADSRQLYETLGIEPQIDLWNLVPPDNLLFDAIMYNYSFSTTSCYWGKCTFCLNKDYGGKELPIEDIPVIIPDHNIVWINSLSMKPSDIIKVFSRLGSRSLYNFYLRGDLGVLKALDNVPIIPTIHPMIGVEFPSDRMLKLMNKGTTSDVMTKVILKFLENGCFVFLFLILGWPNLAESDIDGIKEFLDKLSPFKDRIIYNISLLVTLDKEDNTISQINSRNRIFYIYDLNKEQKKLNDEALQLYKNFNPSNYYNNFKAHHFDDETIFK